jgi:prevent-host-death family protein
MKTVEMTKATAPLAEYARDVDQGPVILTVGGKPVAALVSLENADMETVLLSTNPQFLALIERSRAHQTVGGISADEMRKWLLARPDTAKS